MRIFILVIYSIIILQLYSCDKISNIPENNDITITFYNSEVDFSDYNTFIIRDSVALLLDNISAQTKEELTTISSIIPLITGKLLQYGYTQVDTLSNADFSVNVVLADNTPEDISELSTWLTEHDEDSYLEWYSEGNPIWGDFTGFWYPWSSESIETTKGLLIIEFVDANSQQNLKVSNRETKSSTPDDFRLTFLWQAIISGVFTDAKYDADKGSKAIEEAFNQSKYLQK